jgi:peptidoglycan/LPS O-acetylase OafA/YrhL
MQCSLASIVFLDLGRYSHAPILLENFDPLQKPFVTALANYFGDISFGFYIGHFPFPQTIGRCHITTIRCTGNPSFGIRSSRAYSS